MRVLFLTHRLPYAPNRGDRIRSYHMLRNMQEFAKVDLFSLVDAHERTHLEDLRSWLTSVTVAEPPALWNRTKGLLRLAGSRPLTHILLDAPGVKQQLREVIERARPDVVLAYCSGMARFALEEPLREIPCVLDMVDVDSEKWRSLAHTTRAPWRWVYNREARLLSRFEAGASRHARATLVVNARERESIKRLAPDASVTIIENGIDLEFFRPVSPVESSKTVVFCGVMNYQPNIDGVCWFAHKVWPKIRMSHPEAQFVIVGAQPVDAVRQLAQERSVEVTGAVPDVRPYLWRAALSVAPLLTARGLQNKVLEGLAAGLPVVTTTAVSAGLPSQILTACQVTDEADGFAAAVSTLLSAPAAMRRRIAASADLSDRTWKASFKELPQLLAAAAALR